MSNQEKEHDVHSTLNNENINVSITKKPHCQVKFDIKVSPQAVKASYQKAFKNVNKEVVIPGFRKGRAPDALILEKYQSVIQKEFVDLVLQTGFNEAIHLSHIQPLKDGHVKRPVVHECNQEAGAHFTVEFESRPTIPTVNLADLHVKKTPVRAVTDEECENALQNLRLQFATYDPIKDRAVQENDFIDVSVTLLQEPPREVIQRQRTQVNETGLPSWIRQKVIGLEEGQNAEGMTEQDPKLSEVDPNFISTPFRVTVHAILKGDLPEVNEDLAKKVGLQTIEELKEKIKERLEQESQEEAFNTDIKSIEDLLIETYPFDLPKSYIDANNEARLNDYLERMERQNQSYDKEDYEQIQQMIEKSTVSQLQLFFLLRKIASENHIQVTNDDISQELSRQLPLVSSGRSQLNFNGDKDQVHEQLYNFAFDRKIKQFLIDHIHFQ